MSETVALGFPVLHDEGGGFVDGVRYTVSATIQGVGPSRILTVEHCLTGRSFVREWVRSDHARFSTRLLFRNSAHREAWPFEGTLEESDDVLIANQNIPIRFSDTPEVTCSIVTMKDRELIVGHPECGLTDLWRAGERIDIPGYARIGRHAALDFDDGSLSNLIRVVEEKELDYGQMKTEVRQQASESEKPVTLFCSKDVYDQLHKFRDTRPMKQSEVMQSAIVTQALCAIYGYMEMKALDEEYDEEDINPTLRSHGRDLKEMTGLTWGEEGFNPSLAATKMRPYVVSNVEDITEED